MLLVLFGHPKWTDTVCLSLSLCNVGGQRVLGRSDHFEKGFTLPAGCLFLHPLLVPHAVLLPLLCQGFFGEAMSMVRDLGEVVVRESFQLRCPLPPLLLWGVVFVKSHFLAWHRVHCHPDVDH